MCIVYIPCNDASQISESKTVKKKYIPVNLVDFSEQKKILIIHHFI